ncbi:hypothetical protein BABINDRAFT_161252 [Babjeviella inositovora NRRL Y-12698]|uniref:F-box domain-containing protein n=1 Tax=Babjeviella inositovora NRRL Y-12698 TaxID=984486 RepID=A0A1E3QRK9_9ASCO|nr:uncharacterized protein BABINDRAFT_161252 [Babjeviella inositovora NRRL Y-12698]ODQ80290.1 hypothetical protein BABINDRAFT_161252 [Babjeviella inositovora NRRL Y-12698]
MAYPMDVVHWSSTTVAAACLPEQDVEPPSKRRKREILQTSTPVSAPETPVHTSDDNIGEFGHFIADFPNEIIHHILRYLSQTDLINLSSSTKTFRGRFLSLVFAKIKVHWHDLDAASSSERNLSLFPHTAYARKIRFLDSSPGPEWNLNLGTHLFQLAPSANELEFRLLNSSSWLKYKDVDIPITMITLANINQSPALHKHLFDLNHLRNFTQLTDVTLRGFNVRWRDLDDNVTPRVKTLKLVDCTWEYPFTMTQFDPHHSLQKLTVSYTHNNSFVLSERFQDFLKFLAFILELGKTEQLFPSLQSLEISFSNFDKPPSLNSLVFNDLTHYLQVFDSSTGKVFRLPDSAHPPVLIESFKLPSLRELRLLGWQVNNFQDFYHHHLLPMLQPKQCGWDPVAERMQALMLLLAGLDSAGRKPLYDYKPVKLPLLRRLDLTVANKVQIAGYKRIDADDGQFVLTVRRAD